MSAPVFTLSLRLWHSTQRADDIIAALQLPPRFYHSVGSDRQTPKGTPLDGIYEETYCCFLLEKKMRGHLDEYLEHWCEYLEKFTEFLNDFLRTNGKLEFYASIFLDGDKGFEIKNILLNRICALGLGLSIEMYRLSDKEAARIVEN